MSKGKLIKVCGECANYDWKKHRCKLGCNEGEPQEPFYNDCPLPTVDTDINVGSKAEWISVQERLPEMDELCLLSMKNRITKHRWVVIGYFHTNYDEYITHWMPLPEPPKGE